MTVVEMVYVDIQLEVQLELWLPLPLANVMLDSLDLLAVPLGGDYSKI